MDLDGVDADFMYNDLFKSNTTFNATFDLDQDITAGSQHAIFVLSGCKIMTMENPSASEGLTESTVEIKPQDVSAREFTSTAKTTLFNPF